MNTSSPIPYATLIPGQDIPDTQKRWQSDALWSAILGIVFLPVPAVEYLLVFFVVPGMFLPRDMAIVHLFTIPFAGVAAFLGFRGLRRIAAQPDIYKGRGLAHTGIICAACVVAQFLIPQMLSMFVHHY